MQSNDRDNIETVKQLREYNSKLVAAEAKYRANLILLFVGNWKYWVGIAFVLWLISFVFIAIFHGSLDINYNWIWNALYHPWPVDIDWARTPGETVQRLIQLEHSQAGCDPITLERLNEESQNAPMWCYSYDDGDLSPDWKAFKTKVCNDTGADHTICSMKYDAKG